MRIAHLTLCLSYHITCITGIRVKLRWWFIMSSGVPKFFTYRSVGSRSRGNLGSFCIHKRDAWVWRNRWLHCPFPRWRGRRQVLIVLSIPCIPPHSTRVSESKFLHEVAGRPVLGGLPTYFTLSSNTNYINCMIINLPLYDYTRPMPAQLRTFVYSFFYILSLRNVKCVSTILNISFLPLL
jgi:hypothetical protein